MYIVPGILTKVGKCLKKKHKLHHSTAQCVLCKVRCLCVPGIRYSVLIKLSCALLQTGHLETVHAPVADTVTYFAGLDAPVMDTVTYFGGNHGSRV